MSYCFTSPLQFTVDMSFFVFQWHFHDHSVLRGFSQWCLAAPFELFDWNGILLSSAVKQLHTFSGNLHFWQRLLSGLCVCVEAEAWHFKGLQTGIWQQACRWLHRQVSGRNPHLSPWSQTAAASTCKLGNTAIGMAEGHTAAQVNVGKPAFRHAPMPEPGSGHRPPAPPPHCPAVLQQRWEQSSSRSRGKKSIAQNQYVF